MCPDVLTIAGSSTLNPYPQYRSLLIIQTGIQGGSLVSIPGDTKGKSVLTATVFPLGRLVGHLTSRVPTAAPEHMYLFYKANLTVLFTF